jgi:hypothetical protein
MPTASDAGKETEGGISVALALSPSPAVAARPPALRHFGSR